MLVIYAPLIREVNIGTKYVLNTLEDQRLNDYKASFFFVEPPVTRKICLLLISVGGF